MLKTYKRFAILLSLILTTVSGVGQPVVIPSDREDFHIYLLMGQSNMSGNAVLTGMDTQTDPRILKLNRGNGWEIAKDPISPLYNPAVGPGMAFAKRLIEEKPGITVGLISTAMGGTKISQWERGSALYYSTIWRASAVSGQGIIKGILWHQGEHDGIYAADANVYGQKLQLLIDNMRMDLGNPDLPFIVGGFAPKILKNKNHVWADTVWNRLKWVGENVHMAAYVPTYGVDELGDNLHFSASGQRQMGMRYANALMAMDGTWLAAVQEMMNEQSEDLGDGWKSHPVFGMYFDENFPVIKHAQLGWVKLSVNADQIVQLESTDYGQINISPESWTGGFYLHREVSDPELRPFKRGDEFFVNIAADEDEPRKFYNHTINEWVSSIDDAPEYETILDYYLRAERQFGKTQEALVKTQGSAREGNWSATRLHLVETEWSRYFTILYAQEAWKVIGESKISRQDGDVWRARVMDLISRIDGVLIDAQQSYITLVTSGVPRLPPPPSGEVTPEPNPNPNPDPDVDPEDPEDPTVDPDRGNSWENPIVVGSKSAQEAFAWPQTIVLSGVTTGEVSIYPGREKFSFPCSKPTEWKEMDIDPSAKVNLAVGNFWVIQKIGEKFYAITADYFRKNQFFNQWAPQVFSEKLPPDSPDSSNLAPMYYKKGETYGFMVTTVALNTYRTTNERSNIVMFQMP